jgi:MFS family permease
MQANYVGQARALSRNARLYLISNAIQTISAGALVVLYTLYLTALGYDTRFIGLLVLVGVVGGGIGIVPAGPLVDRLGWRAMLLWSDVIGGAALAVQLIFPQRTVILVTTLAVGISVAIVLVVNSPLLAATSTPRERTFLFGLSNAVALLGAVVGEVLGGLLPGWFSTPAVRGSGLLVGLSPWLVPGAQARAYELALLATGALAVPAFIPVLLMREPPRTHGRPHAPAIRVAELLPLSARTWAERLRRTRVLAVSPIGRFAVSQLLVGFGAGLFAPYVNIYFVNQLGASPAYYGFLTSALSILLAVAGLLVVPLADWLGKVRAAVYTQLSSLPFLVALGLAPWLPVASAVFLIRGPLMNASGPPLQAFLMENLPERRRGLASGVYNISWQVAWALGAAAGGILYAQVSHGSVFLLAAPLYATSALLLAYWFGHFQSGPGLAGRPSKWPPTEGTAHTPTHDQPESGREG